MRVERKQQREKTYRRGASSLPDNSAAPRGNLLRQSFLIGLLFASLTGATYGGFWLWQQLPVQQLSSVDALEHVRVSGPFHAVTQQQVEEILLPYLQRGFFSLNIQAMQTALLQHPWIASATVSRRWPSGVQVEVQEARPLAVWGKDKLLVATGELLPRPEQMQTGRLPELAGDAELVERIMAQYQALAGLLTTRDMEVKRLSFDDLSGWQLELVSGVELRLGHDELLERVNRFLKLSRGILAPHLQKIARVDTRYSNAIAVQWLDDKNSD